MDITREQLYVMLSLVLGIISKIIKKIVNTLDNKLGTSLYMIAVRFKETMLYKIIKNYIIQMNIVIIIGLMLMSAIFYFGFIFVLDYFLGHGLIKKLKQSLGIFISIISS